MMRLRRHDFLLVNYGGKLAARWAWSLICSVRIAMGRKATMLYVLWHRALRPAEEKAVVLIQEEAITQPIDYRDIVRPYTNPNQIPDLLEPLIREVVSRMQSHRLRKPTDEKILEQLDLGDSAAEKSKDWRAKVVLCQNRSIHTSKTRARTARCWKREQENSHFL